MSVKYRQSLLILRLLSAGIAASFPAAMAAEPPAQVATCLACHGDTVASATGAPTLAGQHSFYLQKQLQQFQHGERGQHPDDSRGQQMAAVAKSLTPDETVALADYFAAQSVAPVLAEATPAAAELLDKGRRIYIGSCGACHGAKAEGNVALNAPALHMLSSDYIALQVRHFQHGVRGTQKSDKPGRQMALISRSLSSEQDIAAIAAYIGSGLL